MSKQKKFKYDYAAIMEHYRIKKAADPGKPDKQIAEELGIPPSSLVVIVNKDIGNQIEEYRKNKNH